MSRIQLSKPFHGPVRLTTEIRSKKRLNFGKIPENLTVRKYISLTNQENVKVLVKVKVFGNISKIITPSVEKIILGPGENFQVEITANTTNRCPGFYDGEIDIVVKKPLISYLSFF